MSLPVRVCFILLFFLGMSCTSKVDLSKGGPPQRPELVFPVTIGTVQEGSLTEHAMLVGSVRWARRISLKSEVSAKVLSCSILEGERFNKNDLLVELDITEYQNEINYLEAQKKKAQESLTRLKTATRPEIMQRLTAEIKQREIRILQTRKELDRIQKLIQNRIVTEDELTKATADYEEAVALLDQSKARYEEAKNGAMKEDIAVAEAEIRIQDAGLERATLNLKRCKVYAPFSGVVLQKHIETNAVVGKEDSFMEIASLDDIELRLEVPESYAMRIPENLEFSFTADAFPGEVFQAM
ncbi:MAG: efflux RND transporter periplasmic adaptor subunit, partial [Planctomycetota bacterium]